MKCSKKKNTIQLKNSVIIREFDISGGFRTSRLEFIPDGRNLVDPQHRNGLHCDVIEESSPCREAMIEIDGKVINLGHDDDFSVKNHEVIEGDDSDITLKVTLTNNNGLTVTVFYQIYEDMPFIVKWLALENNSDKAVTVTGCQPEVLTMPADGGLRWRECDRKVYTLSHVLNSPRRPFGYASYNYSPTKCQAMLWQDNLTSRPEKFGFGLANNYVRTAFAECFETRGEEIEKTDLPGIICSCGNSKPAEVFTQFPVGPNAQVPPGGKFESFKSYMFFFAGGYEDGSLALRKMIRRLCPWTRESFTMFKHQYWPESVSKKIRKSGKFDMTPLKKAIDQAAEVGFDYWYFELSLWAQSFGEYIPRPEFPEGLKDMRKVSDYAHSKGLKVGVHSPEDYIVDFPNHYLWSEEENRLVTRDLGVPGNFIKRHPEYVLRNKDGKQARGWCACGASGFHEHLLKVKSPLAKRLELTCLIMTDVITEICATQKIMRILLLKNLST